MTRFRDKLMLLRGLLDGANAYCGPLWVGLDLTRRCNIHCVGCFFHCIQGRKTGQEDITPKDLSLDLARKISRELSLMGTQKIFLGGEGEPMLHPDLTKIIGIFKAKGLETKLFTNGTLMTPEMAVNLVACGLDEMKFSFWAVNHEEHKKCHPGVPPAFLERRLEAIRLLREARGKARQKAPRIHLHMIINRHNFRNIPQRVTLAAQTGCDSVSFGVFRDHGGQFQRLTLGPEDIAAARDEVEKARKQLASISVAFDPGEYLPHARWGYQAWRQIPCYAGWYQAYIKVDGNVWPCPHCTRPIGNLRHQSFASIWNGARQEKFRLQGLASDILGPPDLDCDCPNCCIINHNLKVHRFFRWLRPFSHRRKGALRP